MIVSPDKGVFFVATALMCSATLYGAELSSPGSDPLTRVFVGEPNRLTLPPGFPATAELTLAEESCAPPVSERALAGMALHTASASSDGENCRPVDKPEPGAIVLPGELSALGTNGQASAPVTSVSTAAQAH